MSTSDACHAALAGLLHDAALFPPARLPMGPALEGHARHTTSGYRWMVDRFLCLASRLPELVAHRASGQRLALGVVCDRSEDGPAREALAADVRAAARAAAEDGVEVVGVEARIDLDDPRAAVESVVAALADGGLPATLEVACEVPLAGQDPALVRRAVAAVAAARLEGRVARLLVKLRCGGLEASAFPSAEELAAALVACQERGVAWKATAGLHHPLPQRDVPTGADQHGFLGVLGAAALARRGQGAARVAGALRLRDDSRLRLTREALCVDGVEVGADELAGIRRDGFTAFGTCSVDEPVEDLTALGVLPLAAVPA